MSKRKTVERVIAQIEKEEKTKQPLVYIVWRSDREGNLLSTIVHCHRIQVMPDEIIFYMENGIISACFKEWNHVTWIPNPDDERTEILV
jgi:hypothetical protein